MAKKEAAAKGKAKKAKKESYLKDNFVQVNETVFGKSKVITRAMVIRGEGSLIETLGFEGDKLVTVNQVFMPGIKVKTKKDWKYLIVDKKRGSDDEGDDDE